MSCQRHRAVKDQNCLGCNFCSDYLACPQKTAGCIGCGACVVVCPQNARRLTARSRPGSKIRFQLDGRIREVTGPVSVLDALCELGKATKMPAGSEKRVFGLCGTGGCGSCSVIIDGRVTRSCITPLAEAMEIVTDPGGFPDAEPGRIVTLMRPPPHYHASIFAHGCNYRCELCHNWNLTFAGVGRVQSPAETVSQLKLNPDEDYWIGISGGEPTLNRPWLLQTVREIRHTVPQSRIQLDTNASILTPEYIEQLIEAGVTDISPDVKASRLSTFQKISGISAEKPARLYLETSWNVIRYLNERHKQKIFMAVSLPCHPRLHSQAELADIAGRLAAIDPDIPVTLIEYQPAFRLRDWPFLSSKVMDQARQIIASAGLRKVIVQGGQGVPRAIDPLELPLSSETF